MSEKLQKIFKCKTMGGHDICVVGEYLESPMWLGDVTEKQQGYFITKEQLETIYKCGLNNGLAFAHNQQYLKAEEFLKLNYGVE